MKSYVVYLHGEGVYQNCFVLCIVHNLMGNTINKIKEVVEEKYNIEVEDFDTKFGSLIARTSRKDVQIVIERVNDLSEL